MSYLIAFIIVAVYVIGCWVFTTLALIFDDNVNWWCDFDGDPDLMCIAGWPVIFTAWVVVNIVFLPAAINQIRKRSWPTL